MAKKTTLNAAVRSETGKQVSKRQRAAGQIPAALYGRGGPSKSLVIRREDFIKITRSAAGERGVVYLQMTDKEKGGEEPVLIKEVQHDPRDGHVLHVDFNRISLTEKIRVPVALHAIGDAVGVRDGGILEYVIHELEVECLATQIPARIDIPVAGLTIGQSIHVRDLSLPPGIQPVRPPDDVVMVCKAPKQEIPVEEAPASVEPELIRKKKEDEEGAAATPAPAAAGKEPAKGPSPKAKEGS